jgi:hypothetical protein
VRPDVIGQGVPVAGMAGSEGSRWKQIFQTGDNLAVDGASGQVNGRFVNAAA